MSTPRPTIRLGSRRHRALPPPPARKARSIARPTHEGDWAAGTVYAKYKLAGYAGQSWLSLRRHTATASNYPGTDATLWRRYSMGQRTVTGQTYVPFLPEHYGAGDGVPVSDTLRSHHPAVPGN